MYAVSQKYKAAMKQPVQQFRIRGTIDNNRGTVLSFTDKNVLSFRIANQCTASSTLKIGGVYVGELSAAFTGLPAWFRWNPYREGTVITAYISRRLADDTWEEIPLTPYTMSTMEKTAFGWETVAYDNMSKLDKTYDGQAFSGSIYDMATLACSLCGIEFGMTRAAVQALPNGTYSYFVLYPENDIDTYRDIISYLAQLIGGFATIDRSGKLVFRCFSTAATDTVSSEHRLTGAKFSDFRTEYNRIICYDKVQEKQLYCKVPELVGTYMDLGTHPFLQYGLPAKKTELLQTILYALTSYSSDDATSDTAHALHYTPFTASMFADPAYDLGDVIAFTGGIAPDDTIGCIMSYTWTYHGEYEIAGYGSDPNIDWAKSAEDKALSGLSSTLDAQQMHYYNYTNAARIFMGTDSQKTVVSLRFISTKTTQVNFFAEIKLQAETTETDTDDQYICTDGILTAAYYLGSEEIGRVRPQWTLQDGVHTLHLFFHFSVSGTTTEEFSVRFYTQDCTITIDAEALNATMEGTFLAGEGTWDGIISAEDFLEQQIALEPADMTFHIKQTVVTENRRTPAAQTFTDRFALTLGASQITFRSISEAISNSLADTRFLINTTDSKGTYDSDITITDGVYQLSDQSISSCIAKTADLTDSSITGITSLECTYTGLVSVQYSYDNSTWTEQVPMADFLQTDLAVLYAGMTTAKTIALRIWLSGNATVTEFAINYTL